MTRSVIQCDQFDRLGKGRVYIHNFSLLNNIKKHYLDSREFIQNHIYVKTFEILGINNMTLEGEFRQSKIEELQTYYQHGYFKMNGNHLSVAKELKSTLKFTSIHQSYLSTIIRNFISEQFGLKLNSKTIDIQGVDDNYKYWIDEESSANLLKYSGMSRTKLINNN